MNLINSLKKITQNKIREWSPVWSKESLQRGLNMHNKKNVIGDPKSTIVYTNYFGNIECRP